MMCASSCTLTARGPPSCRRLSLLFKLAKNIAALYALVATCEAGVNPLEYLRDVLLRIA
jgi:hypothetical protein